MRRELIGKGRFLSLVLRHDPSVVGVTLDNGGWVDVNVLLAALDKARPGFTRAVLHEIVETNDKRRFMLSEDGQRIRAAQGHSIGVDLGLSPTNPPDELFHGTAKRHLSSIRQSGLISGTRDHVHLSADRDVAQTVGARHGQPIVLRIDAGKMALAGHTFYVASNGVWLTKAVPAEFIQ